MSENTLKEIILDANIEGLFGYPLKKQIVEEFWINNASDYRIGVNNYKWAQAWAEVLMIASEVLKESK